MDLALYCPVYGYYEKEKDRIGRQGDFYTSVSVGSLFGELLAWQFAQWLESGVGPREASSGCTTTGQVSISGGGEILEAGAHHGQLAKDILGWLRRHRPSLYERLNYSIIEPSARRQEWQKPALAEHHERVRWVTSLGELGPTDGVKRIIFSNELLDAFPVHRLGWDAKTRVWFEWGVVVEHGEFVWKKMPPAQRAAEGELGKSGSELGTVESEGLPVESRGSLPGILGPSKELWDFLPDGYTIDVCPQAGEWWRNAASALSSGKLVAIDYGSTADELFIPERRNGTLRALRGHRVASDVLADPGEQDLTAHVNFSTLRAAGEAAELKTESFITQEQFLGGIAARMGREQPDIAQWTPGQIQQFRTLVHPEYLGRFRVLVQER